MPSDVRIHVVVVPGHDWSIDPQTKVSWSGDVDTVMGFALCVVVVVVARRGFFFVARAQCATRVVRARAGSKAEARET